MKKKNTSFFMLFVELHGHNVHTESSQTPNEKKQKNKKSSKTPVDMDKT